jgi:hypothetical protein
MGCLVHLEAETVPFADNFSDHSSYLLTFCIYAVGSRSIPLVRVYPRDFCQNATWYLFEGRVSTCSPSSFQHPALSASNKSIMVSVVPRSFSMPSPSANQELQLNEVSHPSSDSRCFRGTYPVSFVSSWAALPMLWSHSQGIIFGDIILFWPLMQIINTILLRLLSQTGRSVRLHCSIPMWSSPSDTCMWFACMNSMFFNQLENRP